MPRPKLQAKAQVLSERESFVNDLWVKLHDQAHEHGMQVADQQHEQAMAQQEHQQGMEQQGAQQEHEQGLEEQGQEHEAGMAEQQQQAALEQQCRSATRTFTGIIYARRRNTTRGIVTRGTSTKYSRV